MNRHSPAVPHREREWTKPVVFKDGDLWCVNHSRYIGCALVYSIYMRTPAYFTGFAAAIEFATLNATTSGRRSRTTIHTQTGAP